MGLEVNVSRRPRAGGYLRRLWAALTLGVVGGLAAAGALAAPVSEASTSELGPELSGPPTPAWPEPLALPRLPATVVTAVVPSLPIYAGPSTFSTHIGQLANPNELGAPLVLLAAATNGDWVQAYLPERPNGATGWVPRADVTLASDPYHLIVSLGARRLTLFDGTTPVFAVAVAPGEPASPTPTGAFYVSEILKLSDPSTAYGPYALGTSAFSNTYESFDGGPGQVAIHGTNQPWLIGGYASHGCVRLANSDITTLASQVPAGTPLDIVP